MTRTYWISFASSRGFLGVVVLDVTEEEALAERAMLALRYPEHGADADWLAAALRKAWQLGINPGGTTESCDITNAPKFVPAHLKNRLLTKADLVKHDLV